MSNSSVENLLFSIIIPVFNNENYIKTCVQSVIDVCEENIDQSMFEIIMIDDGSSDRSPVICDELSSKYAVCKTIHTENYGVGHARNVGIRNANGKYITFLDSDDLWKKDDVHFKSILGLLKEERYDLFFVGYYRGDSDGNVVKENVLDEREYDGGLSAVKGMDYRTRHICSSWVRKGLVVKYEILFPEYLITYEDKFFLYLCCWCADKIAEFNFPLYIYRFNPMSVMNRKVDLYTSIGGMIQVNRAILSLRDLWKKRSREDDNEKVRYLFDVLATGNVLEIIRDFCYRSLDVKRLKQILYDNQLNYALENYDKVITDKTIIKQFEFFIKFPIIFAVKYRMIYISKSFFKCVIPTRMLSRLIGKRR